MKTIIKKINNSNIETLLKIGKRVCNTDYAVKYYYNKNHPNFHLNKEKLLKAIRRTWTIGAFNHREIIENMLEEEN